MPVYAHVEATVKCPTCGSTDWFSGMEDLVGFQWGFCPGRLPQKEYIYHIGDPIYWRPCSTGVIPAWTFFKVDGYQDGGNVGDPTVRDLIVRQSFGADYFVMPCPTCGERLSGAAVEIRGGTIQAIWLCKPGETMGNACKIEDGLLLLPGELSTADYDSYITIKQKKESKRSSEERKLTDEIGWRIFRRPDIYVIKADNSLRGMPEWNDRIMPSVNIDCQIVDYQGNVLPTPAE